MNSRLSNALSFVPVVVGCGLMVSALNVATRASSALLSALSVILFLLGVLLSVLTRIALAGAHPVVRGFAWVGWYPSLLALWLFWNGRSVPNRELLISLASMGALGWTVSSVILARKRAASDQRHPRA
jgi:hypothetical protein